MAKKTRRRAAGKKPAASKPRKAAEKKARPSTTPTPPGSGKRRRERKQGRDPSKFRDQKRTPANPGKAREIAKRKAARAKKAAGDGETAGKLDRPSPVDIPLGKDAVAFVRFDTPKSIATKGAIEKLMEKKAKGDDAKHFATFKWACHYLLRVGLEVATSENKWPADADPKDVDLNNAIGVWAAKKWPDAEDRPKTKALIFQLLAIAVETTTHTPAKKKPAA